jgi:tetratricopeptide (TPR) repeat protein
MAHSHPDPMLPKEISDSDYDEKLREMGNYLWDLEQQADIASARGELTQVVELEQKILSQAERAKAFLQVSGQHRLLAAFVAGLGFRMVRRWQDAADQFLVVLQLSPMNGEAWLELSWCLAELDRWDDCEIASRKSVEIFPDNAAPWGNLALALNKLGKTKEAVAAINHAAELDPADPRNKVIRALITPAWKSHEPEHS